MIKKTIFAIGLSVLLSPLVQSQVNEDSTLFIELNKMDSLVFIEGFNKCNLLKLEKLIPSDFEFYHDVGGRSDKNKFMSDMKMNLCSSPNKKPIRKLVEGSLEVYPLYNNGELYGAIQNGTHEFYIAEPEKELHRTGIAKFTSTWLLIDGNWVLKNALSFDHKAAN